MAFILAVIFYVHCSFTYGAWAAHLATTYKRFTWMQKLSPNGVGRLADALALAASVGVYALAGGFQ